VLLDELVELVERPAAGAGAPAPGEQLGVARALALQRAVGACQVAALARDAGVDLADALHPAWSHAGLQVRLDRPLRLTRAAGERLALARLLVEVLPDDPLDG
jgi:hypothetical protein